MDVTTFDKSDAVKPVLVKLYDSHKIYTLASDKNPAARSELTAVVTELLDMELSERESELVADVLIQLMNQVEHELRVSLATYLCEREDVPLRLLLHLANDEIKVAGKILRKSPMLSELDLLYFVKSKTAEYWQEIAQRGTLSNAIQRALVETGDIPTAMRLTENMNIILCDHALDGISKLAREDFDLASAYLQRDEVTSELAKALYEYVGDTLQAYIEDAYNISVPVKPVVSSVLADFRETAREIAPEQQASPYMPSQDMISTAKEQKATGMLDYRRALDTLRAGNVKMFIAQFSVLLSVRSALMEKILTQKTGQALAILCRAHNLTKADFVSVFVMTNLLRDVQSTITVDDLGKAVSYYNRIEADLASQILSCGDPLGSVH